MFQIRYSTVQYMQHSRFGTAGLQDDSPAGSDFEIIAGFSVSMDLFLAAALHRHWFCRYVKLRKRKFKSISCDLA